MTIPQDLLHQIRPGSHVVNCTSGRTAEVLKATLDTNRPFVTVLDPIRKGWEAEWPLSWIRLRMPRQVKRIPRPFRIPRSEPIYQCHCRTGRLEVGGQHEAKCTRCGFLVGQYSLPNRRQRAEQVIRRSYV